MALSSDNIANFHADSAMDDTATSVKSSAPSSPSSTGPRRRVSFSFFLSNHQHKHPPSNLPIHITYLIVYKENIVIMTTTTTTTTTTDSKFDHHPQSSAALFSNLQSLKQPATDEDKIRRASMSDQQRKSGTLSTFFQNMIGRTPS
jgi:hypothetical protein